MTTQEKGYLLEAYNLVSRFNSNEGVRNSVLSTFQWGSKQDLFFYINTLLRYSSVYGQASFVKHYEYSFAREARLFSRRQLRAWNGLPDKMYTFFSRCQSDPEFGRLREVITTKEDVERPIYTQEELRRLREAQLLQYQQRDTNLVAAAMVGASMAPGREPVRTVDDALAELEIETVKSRLESALKELELDEGDEKLKEMVEKGLLTEDELKVLIDLKGALKGLSDEEKQEKIEALASDLYIARKASVKKTAEEKNRQEKEWKYQEKLLIDQSQKPPDQRPQTTPRSTVRTPRNYTVVKPDRFAIANRRVAGKAREIGGGLLNRFGRKPNAPAGTLSRVGSAVATGLAPAASYTATTLGTQVRRSTTGYRTNLITGVIMALVSAARFGPMGAIGGFVAGAAAPEVIKSILNRDTGQIGGSPPPPVSTSRGSSSGGFFGGGARNVARSSRRGKWLFWGIILIIAIPIIFMLLNSSTFCPPYQEGCRGGTEPKATTDAGQVKVEKSGPVQVDNGATIEYTITVTNQSSGSGNIEVVDKMSENVEFVSASDGGTLEGNTVKWNLTGIRINQPESITLRVKPRVNDVWVLNSADALFKALSGSTIDPTTITTGDFSELMRGQGRNINIMGGEDNFVSRAVANAPSFLGGKESQVRAVYKEAVSLNVNPLAILVHWGTETGFRLDLANKAFSCPVGQSTNFSAQANCSAKTFNFWMSDFEKNNVDGKHFDKRYPKCVYDDPFLWAAEMYGPTCRVYDSNEHYHNNFVKFYKQILGAS